MESTRTTRGTGQQRETGQSSRPSQATAQRLDAEVERLMTQAHQEAQSVLTEHRDALERLAQALLQEEVLECSQVLAIVNGAQHIPGGAR